VVRFGDNASVTCEATGEEPFTATMEHLPLSVKTCGRRLQFKGVTLSDAGTYICRAIIRFPAANASVEVLIEESAIDSPFLIQNVTVLY
jgi:hypothetical protein